ncbi:Beta-fimbriae probable major subunit [Pseudomonas synxantha]|uniref:Beta-fimbriae probable major subunit n=1 Tax=Pseudomonas synxantha TaxID=47883 RepID=A0A3G7U3M0_9PSED|nr:DUF1120 domain-containing protein [Pseudomonas synxantha]AZE53292.1 Beta-fimbriae probable major subunit [Pseudomonas synxantha]
MGYTSAVLSLTLLLGADAWGAEPCQLNLSESLLDFGLMNRAIIRLPAPERLLGERRLSLTVNCAQPTDLSLFYRALAANAQRFQLTERGSYRLQASDAVVDGRAVELGLLAGAGQPPVEVSAALDWRPDHLMMPMLNGVPVTGRSLSLQLLAKAWARDDAVRVSDAVTWNASGIVDALASGRSRELRLQARFAPAACTPSLSNGGVVAFGKLSAMDLQRRQETPLPARLLVVSVSCDAPTAFALHLLDNRQGSATGPADSTHYGLGLDARERKIGRYQLTFDPARTTADAWTQVYRTDSASTAGPWSSAHTGRIAIDASRYLGFNASAGSNHGPDPVQNLSAGASLEAVIAPLETLDVANEVHMDGSATLEVVYL